MKPCDVHPSHDVREEGYLVSEPVCQICRNSVNDNPERLIIECPGVFKGNQAMTTVTLAQAFTAGLEAGEKAMQWQDIATAPKDGTEFLSCGGVNCVGRAQPTRWLSPGPYTTENGKNAEGQRRYQWPDGFYWAGYDGFVGPVEPTRWMAMPAIDPAQIAGEKP